MPSSTRGDVRTNVKIETTYIQRVLTDLSSLSFVFCRATSLQLEDTLPRYLRSMIHFTYTVVCVYEAFLVE